MKVLSLFSGGGLGDYGLELAGMEIIGQVEIDDYCQKILKIRWPEVPKWADIRDFDGKYFVKEFGQPDLISGGFPCQDISQAGKGVGITGARSGLWKEMLRIICEVRPRYVLVENVSALLGRGIGVVLGDLAESGYDTEWDCIPASAIGAPHQRDRVWIVAYAQSDRNGREIGKLCEANGGPDGTVCGESISASEESENVAQDVADSRCKYESRNSKGMETEEAKRTTSKLHAKSSSERFISNPASERGQCRKRKKGDSAQFEKRIFGWINPNRKSEWWATEPNVGRVAHGVAKRVDRLKLLGNGQVVQVVQWIGERIMEFSKVECQ